MIRESIPIDAKRYAASHRPTWAAPHGIFNVPPYDRATSRISTSVQYVYRRAPPASARAPAEPQGRPRDPQRAGVTASSEASRPSALRGLSPADRRGAGRGPAARPPGGRSRSAARIRTIESPAARKTYGVSLWVPHTPGLTAMRAPMRMPRLLGVAPFALITKDHDLCTCRMLSSLSWTHTPTHCPLTCSTAKSRMRARARAHTSLIPHTGLHCCKAHDCTVQ